jgi:putative oxidoreductase
MNRTIGVVAEPVQRSLAAAMVRLVTGSVFAAHGAQKLFVFGLDGVTGGFASLGVPMAGVVGPAVALLEFFGGIALALGLFTRVVSAGLAAVMLGAMLLVHLSAGFFAPNGVEFVLVLFTVALALAIAGPGRFSLDALIARRVAER